MRCWLTNGALLGTSLAFLWHFAMIARYGKVSIQEPNLAILTAEIIFMTGLSTLAVCNLVKEARRGSAA